MTVSIALCSLPQSELTLAPTINQTIPVFVELQTELCWHFDPDKAQNPHWLPYVLHWKTPLRDFVFDFASLQMCLSPENELLKLACGIQGLLEQPQRRDFRFECVEPNFELLIRRTEPQPAEAPPGEESFQVHCWFDQGNALAEQAYYCWDALGVRFFCAGAALERFAGEMHSLGSQYRS